MANAKDYSNAPCMSKKLTKLVWKIDLINFQARSTFKSTVRKLLYHTVDWNYPVNPEDWQTHCKKPWQSLICFGEGKTD